MILSILSLLVNTLPVILQSTGVISASMSSLITTLGNIVPTVIRSVSAGEPVADEVIQFLQAAQVEIASLRANTLLDPNALQLADTLDRGITDALVAYEAAGKTTDPSTLTPLPENL